MKGKYPYLILMLMGVALDLGTKEWAFHQTQQEIAFRIPVVQTEYFKLDWHKVENSGGMFGVGQGLGGVLRYFRLAALGLVVFFFLRTRPYARLFLTSLSLIFSGAVGNLYDSFFNEGKVRDFIEVYLNFMPECIFGKLFQPWPTFNVADSMILIGASLLVIQLFRDPDLGEKKADRESEDDHSPGQVVEEEQQ